MFLYFPSRYESEWIVVHVLVANQSDRYPFYQFFYIDHECWLCCPGCRRFTIALKTWTQLFRRAFFRMSRTIMSAYLITRIESSSVHLRREENSFALSVVITLPPNRNIADSKKTSARALHVP